MDGSQRDNSPDPIMEEKDDSDFVRDGESIGMDMEFVDKEEDQLDFFEKQ
jgi:hypothetical protein